MHPKQEEQGEQAQCVGQTKRKSAWLQLGKKKGYRWPGGTVSLIWLSPDMAQQFVKISLPKISYVALPMYKENYIEFVPRKEKQV